VDWLSEDLLLLALDAGRGGLGRTYLISYGLMGADLVRLAARGRIDVVDDQIVVRSLAPTGDAELDAALARVGEPATRRDLANGCNGRTRGAEHGTGQSEAPPHLTARARCRDRALPVSSSSIRQERVRA